MPKFFVGKNQINNNEIRVLGKDVNHIKNVLRKKCGDKLTICDSETEKDYVCEITEIKEDFINCNILEKLENSVESEVKITIFQGLPKADKMELIIQKAVELGVYDIVPVNMRRCVVKLNPKDEEKKIQRWQKISEVAAKQCGRNRIPIINEVTSIKNVCNSIEKYDILIVAYENEKDNTLKQCIKDLKQLNKKNLKICVLIGPEGGIDENEVEELKASGARIITLGKRILRTETVALNVLSIIMYEFDD